MKNDRLPPGQREIPAILRWQIDHPGIVPENPKTDLEKWKLTVDGEVEDRLELSWHDLLNLSAVESISDFQDAYPLRLVVPEKYGYKSAMWIEQITFTKKKELGYWEKRGYSDMADVWKDDRFARKNSF